MLDRLVRGMRCSQRRETEIGITCPVGVTTGSIIIFPEILQMIAEGTSSMHLRTLAWLHICFEWKVIQHPSRKETSGKDEHCTQWRGSTIAEFRQTRTLHTKPRRLLRRAVTMGRIKSIKGRLTLATAAVLSSIRVLALASSSPDSSDMAFALNASRHVCASVFNSLPAKPCRCDSESQHFGLFQC